MRSTTHKTPRVCGSTVLSQPPAILHSHFSPQVQPLHLQQVRGSAPQPVQVTASYAFVRDQSWDEFLAAWYSAPLPPTVGEWCRYIPPALVAGADLEPLNLSIAGVDNTTAHLTWSPMSKEDAASYWLYVKSSYDIGWAAQQIVPLSQTSLTLLDLLGGRTTAL